MSMNLLKETIRFLVAEAAIPVASAIQAGYAIYIQESGSTTRFVLYDPKYYKDLLENDIDAATEDSNGIVAYFQLIGGPPDSCAGAAEVAVSSARKGFGPLMYDICMVYSSTPIMPDRSSVSSSAASVWKYYEKRSDVEKIQLDNNDCKLSDDPWLNFAYKPKFQVNYTPLIQSHKQFVSSLDPATAKTFEQHLPSMGISFFDGMM